MNHTLKHWKEAATLIVAAEQRLCAGTLSSRTPQGLSVSELAHLPHSSSFDYNILLLKRSGKSTFMPNAYVFPGGLVDSSDFSSDWLEIFRSFSNTPSFGLRSVKQKAETRPPIFATDRLQLGSPIPGEVAFRICALRETFEESGLLLVVPKSEENQLRKRIDEATVHAIHGMCPDEIKTWQSLVNQNPTNFIKMCRELEVMPNIWALHEWSNWLTPVGRYRGKRFDTAFFICCLKQIPHTLQDQKEIELFQVTLCVVTYHFSIPNKTYCPILIIYIVLFPIIQWSAPSEVLHSYGAEEVWIAPPQFYELSRLCRFPSLKDLNKFAFERAVEGCEQWMPIITAEPNQHVSLLPGISSSGNIF